MQSYLKASPSGGLLSWVCVPHARPNRKIFYKNIISHVHPSKSVAVRRSSAEHPSLTDNRSTNGLPTKSMARFDFHYHRLFIFLFAVETPEVNGHVCPSSQRYSYTLKLAGGEGGIFPPPTFHNSPHFYTALSGNTPQHTTINGHFGRTSQSRTFPWKVIFPRPLRCDALLVYTKHMPAELLISYHRAATSSLHNNLFYI